MRNFDPFLTLMDSAQVFHFENIDGVYAACVAGRVVTHLDDDVFSKNYFDDLRDYDALITPKLDDMTRHAVLSLPGLRVLNQPSWEALLAFILSANNNVKRIRLSVKLLNEKYGYARRFGGHTLYGFPSPETLSKLTDSELQKEIRCGYRAKYLIETAKMIKNGFPLEELRTAPYESARKRLMELSGVGGKVADCVALFGLGHASAFPVDVWVKRLMANWYGVEGSPEFVRKEARRIFGENCGIYQQSLFHAARTGMIEV